MQEQSYAPGPGRMARRCVCLWTLLSLQILSGGAVYCVSPQGDDAGPGGSWQAPLASVQAALRRAGPGGQVWVAAGIYLPEEVREVDASLSLSASFMLTDGVQLLGGFAGCEDSPDERQRFDRDGNGVVEAWEFTHETILQGDEDAGGSVVWGGREDFSHAVLIDGFTIRGGRALGWAQDGQGGGLLLPGNCVLQNCLLTGNLARQGGGVALLGLSTVRHCAIVDNEVAAEGWLGCGGGVLLAGAGAVLTNSLVLGNCRQQRGAWRGGGGVAATAGTVVSFCTIVANFAEDDGAGICFSGAPAQLNNSVIWGNVGPGRQIRLEGVQGSNCAVQGFPLQAGILPLADDNCGVNGSAANDNAPAVLYPCFQNPAGGDYRLGEGSYLINRGFGGAEELDAAHSPRCQRGTADIGCYESPGRGNLAADFGLEVPLLYARSSQVQPFWGPETPAGVAALFNHRLADASWRQQDGQDILCPESVGALELQLLTGLDERLSGYWNVFACRKMLQVQPRPLLVAAEDLDWYWGGTPPVLQWRLLAGALADGDQLQGELACPPVTGLGTYPILQGTLRVTGAECEQNYRLTFIPGELRCLPGQAELQFEGPQQLTYNGLPQGLAVNTLPAGLPLAVTYEGSGQTCYPASAEAPREAGTYLVTACVQDEFYAGSASISLEILPATLLCQALDQEKMYLADNPELGISYSGFQGGDGLADIFPPQAGTSADQLSPVRAEGYPIILQGGQADNYQLILQDGTLLVRPALPQIRDLESGEAVYGTPLCDIALTGRAVHPLNGQTVEGSFRWETGEDILDAGTCLRGWVFAPGDRLNYLPVSGSVPVCILPRPVQVTADRCSKVYGESEPELTYRITQGSLLAGEGFAGALTRAAGEDAGSYVISRGSLCLPDNYQLSFNPAEFCIEPRLLTVIADDRQKYSSQPDPAFTYQLGGQGLLTGDVLTGALQREAGEAPGEYAILQGNLQCSANYQLTFQPGLFTILEPVLQLREEPAAVELTYGQPLTGELLLGVVELAGSGEEIPGQFVWEEEQNCLPCGSYAGHWWFLPTAGSDYPPLAGTTTILVMPAPLLVRAPDCRREYGQENPPFELEITGFVLQEDRSVLLALPEVTCAADCRSLPGEYPVEIAGGAAANYELVLEPGTLLVEKILLSVRVPSQSKQYGDPDPVLEYVCLTGLLEGDSLSGTPGRSPGETPGEYIFTAGSLTLPQYYDLALEGGIFRILPRRLTVKADDAYPLYGESIPPFTYTILEGSLLPGDSIEGELECWYAKRDTDFPIEIGSLSAGENYQLNFLPGVFHFRKRPLSVTALDCSKQYLSPDNFSRSWQISTGSLVDNDYLAVKLCREPGEAIGQYALSLQSLTVVPAELYEVNFIPGTFSIVRATPDVGVCTYHILYYGDQLAKANLTVEMLESNTSVLIPGEAEWLEPERQMDVVGRTPCAFLFTPEDLQHYAPTIYSVEVQVLPLYVIVSGPQMELLYGEPLPPSFGYQTVPAQLPFGEQFLGQIGFDAGSAGDILLPGQYPFSAGTLQAPSDNYQWGFGGGVLSVRKRPLTIQALDCGKYVGEDDPPLEFQIISGSLLANDSFSGVLRRKSGQKAGEYPINIGTLSAGKNYSLSFLPGVFRIREPEPSRAALAMAPAEVFVLDSLSARAIIYGQALWESELTGQVLAGDGQSQPPGTFSWQEPELRPPAGVREYGWRYVCTETGRTALTGTVRLEVSPAPLCISGCIQKKQPGQPDPALGWAITEPALRITDLPFTGSPGRCAGESPGRYVTNPGSLSFGPNYQIDFQPGELIITSAVVVVDGNWQEKLAEGGEITLGQEQFYYCHDAFSSLQQALDSVSPGGEIFLFPGEYQAEQHFWSLPNGLTLSAWPGQEQAVILRGQLRVEAATAADITVRGLTIVSVEGQPAVLFEAAESCCLEDNLILGGQPALLVKESRGLWLKGNCIVSDCTGLVLGDPDDPARNMTGVVLQQNHFSPAGPDLSSYWHLQIFAAAINASGVLDGSDNYYSGLLLNKDSPAEDINNCKSYIGDGDCPHWPGLSVLKFLR